RLAVFVPEPSCERPEKLQPIRSGASIIIFGREKIAGCDLGSRKFRQIVIDAGDRKSTRLNSSHVSISYAVFCLKKKKRMIFSLDGPQPKPNASVATKHSTTL